jgi:hypothetical protein
MANNTQISAITTKFKISHTANTKITILIREIENIIILTITTHRNTNNRHIIKNLILTARVIKELVNTIMHS